MKNKTLTGALALSAFAATAIWAQNPAANELQQLRDRLAQQEEEIQALQKSIAEQRSLLEKAIPRSEAASPPAADAAPVVPAVTFEKVAASPQKPNTGTNLAPSPVSVAIGNSTLTPLGFVDATYFFRSATIGSGIGTNFAAIPYSNAPNGHLSESNFSAQNSRIGLRFDSTIVGWKVLGYLESDFLFNNNAPSFQITSNSAGMRLRNYFVDVDNGRIEFLGGQDWSLLTPNRKGLSPVPSDIFYTQNMDTNYQLGLTWTRAPQFRVIAHAGSHVSAGLGIENPQQYIGGGNGSSQVALPSYLSSQSSFTGQFQNGSTSIAGVPNTSAVFIAKLAFDSDPEGNHNMHVEVAEAASKERDYIPASFATANKYIVPGTHSTGVFSGELDSNLQIFKRLHLIQNLYWSDGLGRYIFGSAPDVAVLPSGALTPIHALSTLDGFEAQVSRNTMLTFYYGGLYLQPTAVFDPTAAGSTLSKPVYAGYGYAGSTQVRSVEEYTLGWIQTIWKNRNYGSLALINQYSYLAKSPFATTVSTPGDPHVHIVYVDLRYTLP